LEEVLESLQASSTYTSSSLDQQLNGTSGNEGSLGETLGEHDPDLERVEIHHSLSPLLAELSTRERAILIMRLYDNRTQSQIAAEIGVSQMQVSRLLSKILGRLRAQLPA
jgi:RNA polymerase sigma-B factor